MSQPPALAGVTVVVYLKSGQSFAAQTGADGSYAVAVPSGANYTVKFSKTGYVAEAYYGVVVESDALTLLDSPGAAEGSQPPARRALFRRGGSSRGATRVSRSAARRWPISRPRSRPQRSSRPPRSGSMR